MMYGVHAAGGGDSSDSEAETDAAPVITETGVRNDPDLMLVPTIITKVLLPKITELVEAAWDPMCVRACARSHAALHADVFLPALPPNVMEGAGGAFWRRCVGAGVRLLRGALALTAPPALLRNTRHVRALIETLSCAAGAAPGTYITLAATALAETLPRSGELRKDALARLARLAALALSRLEADNPLHLKAIEQARAVIAEAKTME